MGEMKMERERHRFVLLLMLCVVAIGIMPSLTTTSTSGQGIEWRVWMKVSQCSGRIDWVSVAKDNPGAGGGLGFYEIFPGSRTWVSFTEAMAEAESLRSSPLFANYCCRDYSVWQNNQ